jgi:DNA-binding transcriptional ArsR family regulator
MNTDKNCLADIAPEVLERMAQVLKLLAHPQRLKIIDFLDRQGEAPVHAIMEALGTPQSITSLHLNQMKRMNLVAAKRNGKEVLYRIADPRSLTILNCIRGKGGKPT